MRNLIPAPRITKSVDSWKCPWCKVHQEFKSVTAGASSVSDLSGFVDTVACEHCEKESSVSLSIEYRAEPILEN